MSTEASRETYVAVLHQLPQKRAAVFNAYASRPDQNVGMTIREACQQLGWPYNTVSARIFELCESGLLCSRGDTRDDQTVWIVTAQDHIEYWKGIRAAARKAKADKKELALKRLEEAAKNIREHKVELFEDGVSSDLAAEGVKTIPDAFMAGYKECHRIMVDILEAHS